MGVGDRQYGHMTGGFGMEKEKEKEKDTIDRR
jgi:hypothetical protein